MSHKKKTKSDKSASKQKQKQIDDELQVIEDSEDVVENDNDDIVLSGKKLGGRTSGMVHDELKELVEKNIKWSQVIYNQNKKIKHRLTMMVIGNYVRLLLILAPIILGIIFLPALFDQYMSYFSTLLGGESGMTLYDLGSLLKGSNLDNGQVQGIINQIK